MLSIKTRLFIEQHVDHDPALLRLNMRAEEGVDLPFAVEQIAMRQQLREKLPAWSCNFDLIFPSRISAEQCSSELTARYKQRFFSGGSLMDLTGGLGVDFYYLAQNAHDAVYIDKKEKNCEIFAYNLSFLKRENVEVINDDSIAQLSSWSRPLDLIYIDPSRRDGNNKRTYALTDCEPDVVKYKELFFQKAKRLLIKVSPMVDVKQLLTLFPEAKEVHVVSVRNECKEVLLYIDTENISGETIIFCTDLSLDGEEDFSFSFSEEASVAPLYIMPQKYLYEPNTSILKAGAFKSVLARYGIGKLERHSHLYTSDDLRKEFPGRVFEIEEVWSFNSKLKKELARDLPKANLSVRNFPLSVAEIRKQTKLKEGGDIYLFATTLENGQKVLIKAKKIDLFGE